MTRHFAEKIIRDPVHDVIAFQLDQPVDGLLFRLISAAELQRLRRIRQLGLASLTYPGADHSRYSHSLGVLQTARRILAHLGKIHTLHESDVIVCLTGALLHDLGHGPFSHVFESVSGVSHETLTQNILLDPGADAHRTLAAFDPQLPHRLVSFLRERPKRTFYNDILASQLDADRFDYLLRDNLMTGSRYGGFDLNWLLHALTIDTRANRLAVMTKGVSAVEAYLQSRYHMYRNVYFHKVVRTAEGMMKLVLQRAERLATQDRLPGPPRESSVYKSLLGQTLSTVEFLDLDDVSILGCLKLWQHAEDAVLARLCRGLLHRKLFKTIDVTHIPQDQIPTAVVAARKAVAEAGGDERYDLFYDEPADTPYEIYDGASSATDILVQDDSGALESFAAISPMTKTLSRQLMFRRLHVDAAHRDTVAAAVA